MGIDPKATEQNAKRAMAYHDALPANLRLKAKDRQDFKLEEEFEAARQAGYAPDVEDA